ncbi:MAG: helix-turn-helix domain-containing protein [Thermoplasmata archaeon]
MRTHKFRMYPSDAQITALNSTLEQSRDLYNAMLQQRIYAYRSGKNINYNSQQNEIPAIKSMFPEFRNIHSLVIQDIARRLNKAPIQDSKGKSLTLPAMATPVVETESPLRQPG